MKSTYVKSLANGSFPVVPVNTLIRLALGNGTALDVIVSPQSEGTVFSVLSSGKTGGSYSFNFTPNWAYVAEKLRLLEGDAICFVRFIAAQLDGPAVETPKTAAHVRTLNALKVIAFTEATYVWLKANDPQALNQALRAITLGDIDAPQADFLGRMRATYGAVLPSL